MIRALKYRAKRWLRAIAPSELVVNDQHAPFQFTHAVQYAELRIGALLCTSKLSSSQFSYSFLVVPLRTTAMETSSASGPFTSPPRVTRERNRRLTGQSLFCIPSSFNVRFQDSMRRLLRMRTAESLTGVLPSASGVIRLRPVSKTKDNFRPVKPALNAAR